MKKYIEKSAVVAEIERRISENKKDIERASHKNLEDYFEGYEDALVLFKEKFLDTIEVKESLTWEDIRKLYIIFAEVDADIEFCKTTNIKPETIGYYQEVLKRFKAQKGE